MSYQQGETEGGLHNTKSQRSRNIHIHETEIKSHWLEVRGEWVEIGTPLLYIF